MSSSDPISSRDKILDVAESLFARSGFAGVGMRAVAVEVGLGKSSLFHHFPTKSHLYLEAVGRLLTRFEEMVARAAERPTPTEQVMSVVDDLVDDMAEHPTAARLLLRTVFEEDEISEQADAEHESVEQQLMRIVAAVETIIRGGIASGEFRDISVSDITQTLIGSILFHFASGELGEQITHGPIFSAAAVRRRKRHLQDLVRRVLVAGND